MLRGWSPGTRRPRSLLTLKWLTCLFFCVIKGKKKKEKLSGLRRIIPSASRFVPHFVSYLSDKVWTELRFYLSATKKGKQQTRRRRNRMFFCLDCVTLSSLTFFYWTLAAPWNHHKSFSLWACVLFFSLKVGGLFPHPKHTNLQSRRQSHWWRRNNRKVLHVLKGQINNSFCFVFFVILTHLTYESLRQNMCLFDFM